jgi:hypothetical protein
MKKETKMTQYSKLVQRIIAMGVTDPIVAHEMIARYLRTGVLSVK